LTAERRHFASKTAKFAAVKQSLRTISLELLPLPNRKHQAARLGAFCLAGAGGFEPATHGFGVALKCEKVLQILAFSHASTPFSCKTVCRSCV